MVSTMYDREPLNFDEDGFLRESAQWNERIAEQIAREDGIGELSEGHWSVIHYLRRHYLSFGSLMPVSHVCRVNQLDSHCVNGLFRDLREAWRVAGLPNPGEEAKSYM